MKTTILIAALTAGLTLTALDAAAAGHRGGDKPDFATLDVDANGALSRAEMAAAGAARFATVDSDGDGNLTAQELTDAREGRRAKRIEKMVERLDANGDGMLQLNELSRAEKMMDHLDRNSDGEISAEEFEQGMGKRGRKGGKDRR